jgi:hypothetical protein
MDILDSARRRVTGERASSADSGAGRSIAGEVMATSRLELSLSRDALRRFAPLLAARCGLADVPNSPDGLSAAIALAIAQAGGRGRPTVTRRPAGPRTPEYWLIVIDDADATARGVLELAARDNPLRRTSGGPG